MEKQQYLAYFGNKDQKGGQKTKGKGRPKTSHYKMSQQKVLPHITQEFQFRITNHLLRQKIQNPKRDQLISESFHQKRQNTPGTGKSKGKRLKTCGDKENHAQEHKYRDSVPKGNKLRGQSIRKKKVVERFCKTFDDLNSPCNNYSNDYLLSLQNQRMGKRLINTRSVVNDLLTKNYYTYHLFNGSLANRDKFLKINRNSVKFRSCHKNFGKINNGIKSFFQNNSRDHQSLDHASRDQDALNKTVILHDKTLRNNSPEKGLTHHGYETNNPRILQTLGQGSYVFVINKMFINSNPPIKPDSVLVVQMIEGLSKLKEVVNIFYAQKNNFYKYSKKQRFSNEKCYSSTSFPYEFLSGIKGEQFGIKFRIRPSSQVYLRILRNTGIEQRELGIVKIDLRPFLRNKQSDFPIKVIPQSKQIKGSLHERTVFQSKFEGKLQKLNKGVTSTDIKIAYNFYKCHFNPLKDHQTQSIITDL